MTFLILFVLAGAWGWFGYITVRDRKAQATTHSGSMVAFSDQLSVLGGTTPSVRRPVRAAEPIRPVAETDGPSMQRLRSLALGEQIDLAPVTPVGLDGRTLRLSEAQRRRRRITAGLGGAALVSILLAVAVGGAFSKLAVFVTLLTLTYLGLLARARQVEIERAIKVRRILPRPEVPSLDDALSTFGTGEDDEAAYPATYGGGYGYAN